MGESQAYDIDMRGVKIADFKAESKMEEPSRAGWVDPVVEMRKQVSRKAGKSASGKQAAPVGEWQVVFRSSNPKIWNTDFSRCGHFAMPLSEAPDDIQWVKMQISEKQYIIHPLSGRVRLGVLSGQGGFGWIGGSPIEEHACHLGAFKGGTQARKGEVAITIKVGHHRLGWGFGHVIGETGQSYSWGGKQIPQTVFEISVKKGNLSPEETVHLLK